MKIILKGKENVYEQIVNEYKRYISLGVIRKDDKLPSCRALASELGINPNTVQRAYNVLENDGYITVLPKKGVYVSFEKINEINIEDEIKDCILKLKNKNISYKSIKKILDDIYGGEVNDSSK